MTTDVGRLGSSELADLVSLVMTGERLRRSNCVRLWRTTDLTSLGVLANMARERISGNQSFFKPAVHMSPSGRPDPACPECTAAIGAGVSLETAFSAAQEQGGELHLAGGADPSAGVEDLCQLVEKAVASNPRLRLRAFTWQQLECAAERDHRPPIRVLSRLAEAGLPALAGGALIDLTPERPHLDSDSIAAVERRMPWIQAAAELNLKCELSWVFGDGDDPEILTDLLVCIRGIQDFRGIFECVAPLPFSWPAAALELPMPTGYNHLRAVAIGRLFLDNIPRIRSSPFAVSEPLAQIAHWYGADDAGSAGAASGHGAATPVLDRERMIRILREAGREPIED